MTLAADNCSGSFSPEDFKFELPTGKSCKVTVENGGSCPAKWQLSVPSASHSVAKSGRSGVTHFQEGSHFNGNVDLSGNVSYSQGNVMNVGPGSVGTFTTDVDGASKYRSNDGTSWTQTPSRFNSKINLGGGRSQKHTLTLTIPENQSLGTANFVTDKDIEAAAKDGKLKAKNLSITAPTGITLGPVEVDDLLELHAPTGKIIAKAAKAARYDVESVNGDITLSGEFPKSDSKIETISGKTYVTMSSNSGGSATLSIKGGTENHHLRCNGFNGHFESESTYATTHLTAPQIKTSWKGHQEVMVGNGG